MGEQTKRLKLRVLSQNYPVTPGLDIIQDYWKIDDDTLVVVADPELALPGMGFAIKGDFGASNVLSFIIGKNVDAIVPVGFWPQLKECYGGKEFWKKLGSVKYVIPLVVAAINTCIQDPKGECMPSKCDDPPYKCNAYPWY